MLDNEGKEGGQMQGINFFQAYKMTGEAKASGTGIFEFLDSLIENNTKFIIFAHHQNVIDMLEDGVKKRRVPYVRITG
jgi:SWI/SNF-related matrix-associated actin-dependent regulator of chromatin subfamily A-like protein 1